MSVSGTLPPIASSLSTQPSALRVGFVWHCSYPWDIRLEKMIRAVTESGHRAFLVCKGKEGLPQQEEVQGLRIHRVGLTGKALFRPTSRIASYPVFANPLWIHQTRAAMQREKVDVIIVRDLPLAMMASWVGKRLKVPVVLDMAENYPAALVSYKRPLYKPFLVHHAWLPRRYEAYALKKVDHVFVVAEEQRLRLLNMGVNASKITQVGNTPEPGFYAPRKGNCERIGRRTLNLLYVGFVDNHRGIESVIRGLAGAIITDPGLRLTIVGDGRARPKLIELAASLGLAEKVTFPGWVPFERVRDYIEDSDICLIPHLRSEHTETTIPNKLFDYMAFGKPILAADCAPIKRILDEASCGWTFPSGSATGFREALEAMLRDPERQARGRRGQLAVEDKYNWTRDRAVFLQALQQLSREKVA